MRKSDVVVTICVFITCTVGILFLGLYRPTPVIPVEMPDLTPRESYRQVKTLYKEGVWYLQYQETEIERFARMAKELE